MRRALLASCGCAALIVAPVVAQSLADRINEAALRSPGHRAKATSRQAILRSLSQTRMTLRVHQIPAIHLIEAVATASGVPIVAHTRENSRTRGMDGNQPVSLDVVDTPALAVLETVLEACSDFDDECTWQVRRGTLEVGTKRRLAVSAAQEVRYYPIADLLFEVPDFDNAPPFDIDKALGQSGGGGAGGGGGTGEGGSLVGIPGEAPARRDPDELGDALVELIREVIEPDGWRDRGGDWGSIRYYEGTIIVRAPDFIHRQLRPKPARRR